MIAASADHQTDLLSFLRRPESYPENPAAVEIRQTHISIVALTPSHAYKLKKALDLGFLDYSTLEKRRQACEAEVRLNQRLSHDIYLGVVPISRRGSNLAFGGDGDIIDYAVQMRTLREQDMLDQRLAQGAVGLLDVERVADKLAKFYAAQSPSARITAWGQIEKLRLSTDENFAQTKQFVGTLISRPAHEAIQLFTQLFYERHAALLERRCSTGAILDCHGDLRCEHVHFVNGDINIIDCIEFNDRFRYIDVANDIAFLAMDLDFRGRSDLAAVFAQRIATARADQDLLALVDFYKYYRAYVRGKVSSIKSAESEVPAAERQRSRDQASRFFALALSYALTGSEPLLLAITGRIGTGKSSVAHVLGDALHAPVFSSDRIRKELAGVTPWLRSDAAARPELYSAAMTKHTYEVMITRGLEQAKAGRGAVLDATFGKREHRDFLRERAKAAGVRHAFVELRASDEQIQQRLLQRETSEREISDARLEDFETLSASFEPHQPDENGAFVSIGTGSSPEATGSQALKALIRAAA